MWQRATCATEANQRTTPAARDGDGLGTTLSSHDFDRPHGDTANKCAAPTAHLAADHRHRAGTWHGTQVVTVHVGRDLSILAERRARAARVGRAALTCMLVVGSIVAVGAQPSASAPDLLRATTRQAADQGLSPSLVASSQTQPPSTRHDRSRSNDLADDVYRAPSDHPSQAASSLSNHCVRVSDDLDASPARAPPAEGSI